MKSWQKVVVAIALLSAAAYLYTSSRPAPEPEPTGLANPASVHCEKDLGGDLDILDTPAGQTGYCRLPNGDVCEEWDLYRSSVCTPPPSI